jgi:hypothetical protein
MSGSTIGTTPPRVIQAARAHDLGGPVTSAQANRLSMPRVLGGFGVWVVLMVGMGQLAAAVRGPGWIFAVLIFLSVLVACYVAGRWMEAGGTLYLHERGAVVDHPRRPVEVLAWTDLLPCEHHRRLPVVGGHRALTIRVGPRAAFTCAEEVADRIADVIAAMEQPRASAVLAAGGTLDYGVVQVSREALVLPRFTLPWAAVTGMRAEQSVLLVFAGTGAPVSLRRDGVAHQRTLLRLGPRLADDARRIGRF